MPEEEDTVLELPAAARICVSAIHWQNNRAARQRRSGGSPGRYSARLAEFCSHFGRHQGQRTSRAQGLGCCCMQTGSAAPASRHGKTAGSKPGLARQMPASSCRDVQAVGELCTPSEARRDPGIWSCYLFQCLSAAATTVAQSLRPSPLGLYVRQPTWPRIGHSPVALASCHYNKDTDAQRSRIRPEALS